MNVEILGKDFLDVFNKVYTTPLSHITPVKDSFEISFFDYPSKHFSLRDNPYYKFKIIKDDDNNDTHYVFSFHLDFGYDINRNSLTNRDNKKIIYPIYLNSNHLGAIDYFNELSELFSIAFINHEHYQSFFITHHYEYNDNNKLKITYDIKTQSFEYAIEVHKFEGELRHHLYVEHKPYVYKGDDEEDPCINFSMRFENNQFSGTLLDIIKDSIYKRTKFEVDFDKPLDNQINLLSIITI